MLGTYGSSAFQCSDQFHSARDYLLYLFSNTQGFHTRNTINGEKFAEYFYRLDKLVAQPYFGVPDCYCSLNSCMSPRRKGKTNGGRTVNNIKHLNALFVDIDCYKNEMSPEQVLYTLQEDYFDRIIPVPTFAIHSGRGLYLIWHIDEDRNALPRWQRVESYLVNALRELGADEKAMDAARILRVPFTFNSKSGKMVSIMQFSDITYTLHEIASEYGIQCAECEKATRNQQRTAQMLADHFQIVPPDYNSYDATRAFIAQYMPQFQEYGKATIKQQGTAKMLATHFHVALPDFDNYKDTDAFIAQYMPLYKASKAADKRTRTAKIFNLDAHRATDALATGRIRDLYTLFSAIRKGADCCREVALFLCRAITLDATQDADAAIDATLALNAAMDCPFSEQYVRTTTASAEKKWRETGKSYRYPTAKIIAALGITDAEQAQMEYLRQNTATDAASRKRRSNRLAYLARIAAQGKTTKTDAVAERRMRIQIMLQDGMDAGAICAELGISARTFARDKSAIMLKSTTTACATAQENKNASLRKVRAFLKALLSKSIRKFRNYARFTVVPKIQPLYYNTRQLPAAVRNSGSRRFFFTLLHLLC